MITGAGIQRRATYDVEQMEPGGSAADYATLRRILEIVCLNCRLDDVSLAPTIRKPFDLLANDQSVLLTRGDRI